jgi:glucokinase
MAHILAADIGGTNSRFGHFEVMIGQAPLLLEQFSVPTASVQSFAQALERLRESGFGLDPKDADRIVLAVAGAVQDGVRCRLTNASWDIDLVDPGVGPPLERTFLINDFVAQALGCQTGYAAQSAITIQKGVARPGVVAAVGAGTGLGLCALAPLPGGDFLPLPSEGGHAPQAFVSRPEFEFLEFLQARTGQSHGFGDIMVSGPGLSLLHEFLTGRRLAPAEVARQTGPDSETTRWFSRFYGRACRAYALYVLAWGGVYLCGGLAAKNPFLVANEEFLREFRDCPAYGTLLENVPIRLITTPDTGLYGAARYGQMRLNAREEEESIHIFVA